MKFAFPLAAVSSRPVRVIWRTISGDRVACEAATAIRTTSWLRTAVMILTLVSSAPASADSEMAVVSNQVASELGRDVLKIASPADFRVAQARVETLLATAVTADSAAQIALLNHRGLQAEYNTLGIAEAAIEKEALPPIRPWIPVNWEQIGAAFSSETGLHTVAELGLWLKRRAVAEAELKAATFRAVEATFRTDAEARRAFYRAVAARQTRGLLVRARDAAEIAAELTRKQGETGAATQLMQARAALLDAEFSAELLRAELEVKASREELTRALGLETSDTTLKLPDRLPEIPETLTAGEAGDEAFARRVELMAARMDRNAAAWSLGIPEALSSKEGLDPDRASAVTHADADGRLREAESSRTSKHADEAVLEGETTSAPLEREAYMAAANRLAALEGAVRSEVREARARYRATYEIALLYQNSVVPFRQIIDEQTLLEYNGMLVDVLDLLAAARDSFSAAIAATNAQRDFFIAEIDFQTAIIGGGGSGGGDASSAEAPAAPEAAGGH